MGKQDFINQLQAIGHNVEDLGGNRLAFTYVIPVGNKVNEEIKLGFEVADDFPINPPSGPHVYPRILPINTVGEPHPKGGVHESPNFGSDWEYWSRPFPNWSSTDRSVKTYMSFVRYLLETL
jgi:hypothetical protein